MGPKTNPRETDNKINTILRALCSSLLTSTMAACAIGWLPDKTIIVLVGVIEDAEAIVCAVNPNIPTGGLDDKVRYDEKVNFLLTKGDGKEIRGK